MEEKTEDEILTTIQNIETKPGQRLLVVSDIHGHLNRLVQLLKKMNYDGDDILIIVGDLIDKGPESLRVVQYVMDLCRQHPVYVSMGNVEQYRLQMLWRAMHAGDSSDTCVRELVEYLHWSAEVWGSCLFQEMLSDIGVSVSQVTSENVVKYMSRVLEQFREELNFLQSRPVIMTAGDYLFVHGGVPTEDLSALEGSPAVQYLKNDNFRNQGYRFSRYTVVTGHWPTFLYRPDEENGSPLFDSEKRIICIDGGCGLKFAGQLNGIMIPGCNAGMEEISWIGYDDFPIATALKAQKSEAAGIHIQYFDNVVELLGEMGDMAGVRQLSTGKKFDVPQKFLTHWNQDGRLRCGDYCDTKLEVDPGEKLSLILEAGGKYYVKNRLGKIGWYEGMLSTETATEGTSLQLKSGAPKIGCWRRERELAVYEFLEKLDIPFSHIDHGEANTMEACAAVDAALGDAVICKNLFLCNQQRTCFYLLMMPGDKKFKTKELSKQIGSARLSFAEATYMELFLHIAPGSVSVMGLMNDRENRVQLLIDRDVLKGEWFGCHPCVNTSSICIRISDLLGKFLPAVGHEAIFVNLVGE